MQLFTQKVTLAKHKLGGDEMFRVNGYYLYNVGASLCHLRDLDQNTTLNDAQFPLLIAKGALEPFIIQSVFKPKISLQNANHLLGVINELLELISKVPDKNKPIEPMNAYLLGKAHTDFETVLSAEFGQADLFLVSKKRGYDMRDLIENGTALFPEDLGVKVPKAILDVNEGARCLAFELPTAAGFHFHRANESVLHLYYDAVTKGKPRPTARNIGEYINTLNKHQAGDPIIISALKDLKDFHRNPLIHPEHTIESIDEAIALLGSIHCVIVHMLKEIPIIPPFPTTNP